MSVPFHLGLDLGTVNIKLSLATGEGERLRLSGPSRGNPQRAAMALMREAREELPLGGEGYFGVTGAGAASFVSAFPELRGVLVNEIVAAATFVGEAYAEARTVIDLGGQFSKWILIDREKQGQPGRVKDFALNGLCAAGSGAFLEQQATRLRMSPAELGELAAGAARGATIAGRCSVFAKSDMVHLQQKGTPPDEIAYGLCQALSRTFLATVLEGRFVERPVALVGGGASSAGLVRALADALELGEGELIVPDEHFYACAEGAALLAGRELGHLEDLGERLRLHESGAFECDRTLPMDQRADATALVPLTSKSSSASPSVPTTTDVIVGALGVGAESAQGHVGIDVGSVSTNVVLLSPDLELLEEVYVATRGRPVEALDEALGVVEGAIERSGAGFDVLSVGATGSGRHLAARLVGADIVKNEITAQLVSAEHVLPKVDTIFEIGGQDSKFIDARGGLLRDFEMNKICAAGTGSFLEEQAERLGVNIIGEFSELALRGEAPVDLGSRCTVFMDTELSRSMAADAHREDLCAGLAYSVARNYLEKVVAGRDLGETIVFQGGTSANKSVVSAFEQLLGRSITVHPHGRVSGAIGAALLAAQEHEPGAESRFRGFGSCRDHQMDSFECRKCENRCQVNRVRVVGTVAHFGDICERFAIRDRADVSAKESEQQRPFPELFTARARLLEEHLPLSSDEKAETSRRPKIGLTRASLMVEYLPFWAHLLDDLGFEPVIANAKATVGKWTGEGLPPEVCLPLKLATAQVRHLLEERDVDRVLLPAVLELAERHPGDRGHTCLYAQQLPDMAKLSFGARLLTPQVGLSDSKGLEREATRAIANALGTSVRRVRRSWPRAFSRQASFVEARQRMGREALAALAESSDASGSAARGVIVLGKPYNLHSPAANLGLARHLDKIGLAAIPMDMLPLGDEVLDDRWYMLAWQLNRDQARALQHIASRTKGAPLFPIHVSSYGCGPDAFTVKHLERAWGDRPRLFLEFDEHQGEAGLITRLEAFADEIDQRQRSGVEGGLSRPLRAPERRDNREVPKGTRCLLPYTSEHVHAYAGALRRTGLRTRILEPPDAETLRLGEEVSSGRECHPYAIIAGDLAKLVVQRNFEPGDHYFMPSTRLPCLLGQYGDGFRRVLEAYGEDRLKVFDQHPGEAASSMGSRGMVSLYEGLTIVDYLIIAGGFYRVRELTAGSVDEALRGCYRMVEDCIADGADARRCLRRCLSRLGEVLLGPKERRPIIGVTGDLYTRINAAGNASLFQRLESMGCTVWAGPFYAAGTDFETPQKVRRWLGRGIAKPALKEAAVGALLATRSARLAACLDGELRERCVEPPQRKLQKYALRYVGANSNHLVRGLVAKMADFADRGAHGVISAVGLGCMVGTSAASAIPAIRRDFGGVPIVSIAYGGSEGPAQQIQLETFVHQARQRFESERA